MIKNFVLEKIYPDGTISVTGRYSSYYKALKLLNMLNCLKFSLGVNDIFQYRIIELPLVHIVYQKDVVTKIVLPYRSCESFTNAISYCNYMNRNNDGTLRYYVGCAIKED